MTLRFPQTLEIHSLPASWLEYACINQELTSMGYERG
jgi:hypothetical protein